MGTKNNTTEKDIARCIIEIIVSVLNIAVIYIVANGGVYALEIPFLIISILFVYICPFVSFSYRIIGRYRHVDESVLERMPYSTRCMLLSQVMYLFVKKVLDIIAVFVTYCLIGFLGFFIWLIIGNKSTIGVSIKEFIASLRLSQIIIDIYNKVSGWLEQILEFIFRFEIKTVDKLIGREHSGRNADDGRDSTVDLEEYARTAREEYINHVEQANSGDAKAQIIVGNYCMNYGNQEEAVKWFIRAANAGEASAYTKLGHCYMNGIGVDADLGKAVKLYKQAAAMQDTDAMCFLADFYIRRSTKQETIAAAIKLYVKAARMGDVSAQEHLGVIYYEGKYTNKNESQAYFWLKKAVEENDNYHGGYYLAKCYLDGIGTEADSRKGFDILKKTVERDCSHMADCLKLLSQCYQNGIGVNKNAYMARIYIQKANRHNQQVSDILDEI